MPPLGHGATSRRGSFAAEHVNYTPIQWQPTAKCMWNTSEEAYASHRFSYFFTPQNYKSRSGCGVFLEGRGRGWRLEEVFSAGWEGDRRAVVAHPNAAGAKWEGCAGHHSLRTNTKAFHTIYGHVNWAQLRGSEGPKTRVQCNSDIQQGDGTAQSDQYPLPTAGWRTTAVPSAPPQPRT